MSKRSAAAAVPRFDPSLSDADVAARGMCRAGNANDEPCGCDLGGNCIADDMFGREALGAISALRAAGRLPLTPANRPCVERSETGSCLACEALQGEPCQHPALKL